MSSFAREMTKVMNRKKEEGALTTDIFFEFKCQFVAIFGMTMLQLSIFFSGLSFKRKMFR
jgi:uncharacterized membrane protein YiaA